MHGERQPNRNLDGWRAIVTAKDALRIVNPSKAVVKVLEITETFDYLMHGRPIGW